MEPMRTWLFAPGNHPRKVEKVFTVGADAVVIDLEDAVALEQKIATRATVVEALKARPTHASRGYIRVNAIAPGAVLPERVRNLMEQDNDSGPPQEIIEKHLLGLGHPQQVASVALFFACDDSNWVTGQILPVDGGASVH